MKTARYPGAFFGEPWPSGVCDEGTQVPVPFGEKCILCETSVGISDQGSFMGNENGLQPAHRECLLRSVVGGIGHHRDHYFWCRQKGDPDGGYNYRESALQVWTFIQSNGRLS